VVLTHLLVVALKMLGQEGSPTGAQAQQMADPFSQYRANLGAMYAGALQPGAKTNIEAMPGFSQYKTGVLDPAMEAQQRKAASSGMLYSGNEAMALQKTGQQGYYGFMTDYLNRLAQGSGATQNPATAAGMGLAQTGINQQGFMQGMGALGQIAGQYATPSTTYAGDPLQGNVTRYGTGLEGYESTQADIYGPPAGR